MARITNYHNASCLCCGTTNKDMISVGPMVFCNRCYRYEFTKKEIVVSGDFACTIDSKCKEYVYWLNKYKKLGVT